MSRLVGKTCLVTGAASGIGRATSFRCAAEGARVLLADCDGAGAAVAAEIGGDARFYPVDVGDEPSVRALFAAIEQEWGELHAVIHAAGILRGAFEPPDALSLATWELVQRVNLTGSFLCAKYATPLLERTQGVLILVGSGAGVRGGSSSVAYGASKGGVHGLGMTLERHLGARGIRVHVVCPGGVDTPMKRQNLIDQARAEGRDPAGAVARARLWPPESIAAVLAFLASDDAAAVIGTIHTR